MVLAGQNNIQINKQEQRASRKHREELEANRLVTTMLIAFGVMLFLLVIMRNSMNVKNERTVSMIVYFVTGLTALAASVVYKVIMAARGSDESSKIISSGMALFCGILFATSGVCVCFVGHVAVKFSMIAVPVIFFGYLIYHVFKKVFFTLYILCAFGAVASYFHYRYIYYFGTFLAENENYMFAAAALLLVLAAFLVKKRGGSIKVMGTEISFFDKKSSFLPILAYGVIFAAMMIAAPFMTFNMALIALYFSIAYFVAAAIAFTVMLIFNS